MRPLPLSAGRVSRWRTSVSIVTPVQFPFEVDEQRMVPIVDLFSNGRWPQVEQREAERMQD
jgi:hypothetical protein